MTKEFFQILIHNLFDENYGMFVYRPQTRTFWFNMLAQGLETEFELVGIVVGLAVYNQCILDVHFPLAIYKKLLLQSVTLQVQHTALHVKGVHHFHEVWPVRFRPGMAHPVGFAS